MIDSALRRAIEKLKDPAPSMREEGIQSLDLLGDTDALSALAEVFSTDSAPELRALAQQVGKSIYYRAIRQQLEAQGASEDERRQAAEILARAEQNKRKRKR